MILLVDNYDSFTFNLQRYLVRLDQSVCVLRNDAPQLDDLLSICSAIILSPGPKTPSEAGRCLEIVRHHSGRVPILGICLGHQVIFQAFGGTVVRAARPIHGRSMAMHFAASPLFVGIKQNSRFARYHSLVGDPHTLPPCLRVTATSATSEIMAIDHMTHPTFGIQFHPESVLSTDGYQLLANFLSVIGLQELGPLPARPRG
ncbi:MAG: aminodeoxychorismate/anthranilate synthase component II [Pirellulaceae bacterium]